MRRPRMTFRAHPQKRLLSSEESLNEESPCKEPSVQSHFARSPFDEASLDETSFLPQVRRFRRKRRHDGLRRRGCGRGGFLGRSCGAAAFAGAPVDSTTFAGAIATTGFPQFVQNLASRGSFAPHFVQYMPVILYLIRFFSLGIVSPDASGTCQRPPMRVCLHDFFTRFIPLFRNTPFDYSCIVETIPNEKRGHVLQPLRNRKREHSEVLPPMRKHAPSKRAIE